MKALQGLKVLDCTHVIAGSWASMILADLGADVVKIERIEGGALRNYLGKFRPWDFVNRNKRAIAVNLATPEGQDIVKRLIKDADVFVQNYRPGILDKWGLGYTDLSNINKGLIYCSISGFGQSGPYKHRGGLDLVAQAISGIMSFVGPKNSDRPSSTGMPLSDLNSGVYGAVGILAALQHRHKTGEGQHVETTLQETALTYTLWESAMYFRNGTIAGPRGSASELTTPYEAYRAKDSFIAVGVPSEFLWGKFCEAIQATHLKGNSKYKDRVTRLANRASLVVDIELELKDQPATYWSEQLALKGVPAAPVNNIETALQDPQIEARGSIEMVEGQAFLRVPITLSKTPVSISRPPAEIGDHSQEVLKEHNFTDDELKTLIANKIIKGKPYSNQAINGFKTR